MNDLPEKVRAFVALRMGADVENALAGLIAELRDVGHGVRWVHEANIHLTLRFLGAAVDSRLLPPLVNALTEIAAGAAPFALSARGTGAFPNLKHPRVIWVGLESAELSGLADQIETASVRCGFEPERRPYSPHLTIGRVADPRGWLNVRRALEDATERHFGTAQIEDMILYRSVLGRHDSKYEELARFRLGRATPTE